MEKIKFSIIMPCYNSASHNYFIDAIDSVVAQEYQNWELITVNDGSTDGTLNILNSYAKKDSRIRVFSKHNGGYSSAINMGLDHLSGEYFIMMGSDDQLFPNLLKTIEEEMNNEYPDMIAFRTIQFVEGVLKGTDSNTDYKSKEFLYNTTVARYVEKYPNHAKIFFVRDTSKCYKTALLGNLRLFGKYGYDADGIFAILFAHKAKSFMSIPVDGYHWTLRDDSVSATTNLAKNLDRLCNWNHFFEANKELQEEEVTTYEISYACSFANLAQITALSMRTHDSEYVKSFRKAVKCIPNIFKRYGICLDRDNSINLLLLSRFPRLWRAAIEKKKLTLNEYYYVNSKLILQRCIIDE